MIALGSLVLTQILWWSDNALMCLLLIFAWKGGLFGKYTLFYTYLMFVLTVSIGRFYVYAFIPDAYLSLYWYTQFLNVAAGYGITLEIYSNSFRDYPGTARMSRFVVSSVFVAVIGISIINILRQQGAR